MKKVIALFTVMSMVTLISCGESSEDSEGSTSSSTESSQSDSEVITAEESSESSDEESTVVETTTEEDDGFFDFNGLNIKEPDSLCYASGFLSTFGHRLWMYDYETDDRLNFSIVNVGMNYADCYDPSTYGLDDVWGILSQEFEATIGDTYFDIFTFDDAPVIDTTEKVDVLGEEFIRQTGTYSYTEFQENGGDRIDIHYAMYYGLLDFPAYDFAPEFKRVPIMWVAYSDVDSAERKAEMEKIVDDVAENASWLEDKD